MRIPSRRGPIGKRLAGATQGIFRPVDYSRRTAYRRPPALYRRLQWLGVSLASCGIVPEFVVVLEVRGRRTGRTRRTVLAQASHEGERYLVSLAGESEWVRNVRAAGGRAVVRHGRARQVLLVEVPSGERPPIIQAYLHRPIWSAPAREARSYFGLRPGPSLNEIRAVADRYPVFRITGAPDGDLAS